MKTLAVNKRAKFDYEILSKYEAGLVLFGHEVKSVKTGHISLKGSFVSIKQARTGRLPELFLVNAHISKYKHAGNLDDYDVERSRKLLIKKNEIRHLIGKKQEQGLTLIPLRIYTKHSFLKLEFATARGKKKYDKRDSIKKRELDRKSRTLLKKNINNL